MRCGVGAGTGEMCIYTLLLYKMWYNDKEYGGCFSYTSDASQD